MQNIKVNYTGTDGRTSTTINGNICWAYFKTTDTWKNDEGDKTSYSKAIQEFVNDIIIEPKYLNKAVIEDLLIHSIMSHEFERGWEKALALQAKP